MLKAPVTSRSFTCGRGTSSTRSAAGPASIRALCTCNSVPQHRELTVAKKTLAGAAATLVSFGAFAFQPALADLNKFEAAAGGEFNVGTAAQYGEAELRGKDFSGQVLC